ncbi:response regulator transcription factor [Paenibacillus macerans]|uniref:response regulator transcription factor n=1 Tax=Paenibacillus macerans TaxID=44252 RepID=UPI003D31ADBC
MFQILVVDDHPHQVDSIIRLIEDSALPCGKVHGAYSARESMDLLDKHPIDVVITDIRMPEISGIELIEHIRRTSSSIRCILLSGFAEFEYAQKALQLQTSKYLMKPVDSDELVETLEKLFADIEREREEDRSYQKMLYTLRENLPILREQLLRDLLRGMMIPREELVHKLAAYEIPMDYGDSFMTAVLQMEDDLAGYTEYDTSLIIYAVTKMAEELLAGHFCLWYTRWGSRQVVFLIKPREDEVSESGFTRLENEAKELQRQVYKILKHIVSIGIVKQNAVFPAELLQVYEKTRMVIGNHDGKIASFFAAVTETEFKAPAGSIASLHQAPTFMQLLETDRWTLAGEKLNEIFTELEAKSGVSDEYLQEAFYIIAGSFHFVAHQHGHRLSSLIGELNVGLLRGHIQQDLKTFKSWAFRSLDKMASYLGKKQQEGSLSLVHRIRQYVASHLDCDLSLQAISDAVGLHPAYLSKVYKEQTGENLSDYILKYRMEQAVGYLKQTDCRIYEVAAMVGYLTPHYFIKQFKKYYGITPQHYRDALKIDGHEDNGLACC